MAKQHGWIKDKCGISWQIVPAYWIKCSIMLKNPIETEEHF